MNEIIPAAPNADPRKEGSIVSAAPSPLLAVEQAKVMLAACTRADVAKDVRDKAELMRAWLQQQKASREAQNDAAEIKVRAERRLGEMLAETNRAGGGRPKKPSHDATVSPPTLAELGIDKDSANRWQKLARVSEKAFEKYLGEMRESTIGEITSAGARRLLPPKRRVQKEPDYNNHEVRTEAIAEIFEPLGVLVATMRKQGVPLVQVRAALSLWLESIEIIEAKASAA